ncbi:MAG: hypothetical protein KatS3mg010_0048 [Acidimicrobiia bacterium]|nr:MAG: hypothetical protein KatS3mg010_0048 [Acidimicrobiia bacterium]
MTRPGPRRPRRRAPADRRAPAAARRPPQPHRQAGLGGDQVEGRRAVLELLRAGRREVKRVFVAANVEHDDALDEIVERAGARLQVVPPQRLEQLAGTDAPQGVVARAAPLRESDLDGLLARDDAFLVALDGVTDPGNLGAIARVAETAGATGLVVARHRSARLTPAVTKAAAGAIEYLAIATVGGIPAALDRAQRVGRVDGGARRARRP